MIQTLLVLLVIFAVAIVVLQILQLRRRVSIDLSPVQQAFKSVEESYTRSERAVREEIGRNRQESSASTQQAREELSRLLKSASDTQLQQLSAFNKSIIGNMGEIARLQKEQLDVFSQRLDTLTQSNDQKLETMRKTLEEKLAAARDEAGRQIDKLIQDSAIASQALKEEIVSSLKSFGDLMFKSFGELSSSQRSQVSNVIEQMVKLTDSSEKRLDGFRVAVDTRLQSQQEEAGQNAKLMREEIFGSLKSFGDLMVKTFGEMGHAQRTQLGGVIEQLEKLTQSNEVKLEGLRSAIDARLQKQQEEATQNGKLSREEIGNTLKGFNDSVLKGMSTMSEGQQKQVEILSNQLNQLIETNAQKMDAVKLAVEEKLKGIQEDNAKQLEQIRKTVDEQLQGTLEKRLGESFKQVSERLEAVHKGLGEMQVLATGVGDLKKVLTNVKTRGTWGEVQLGAMLEQVLTPDQYEANVATKEGQERVEFAIRLPGRGEDPDEIVWLPIDAKFPVEDYQRLIEAQEQSDAEAAEVASKMLENRIKGCAADICEKYINPPKTTDFGMLFLPTEGLFAEVIRRAGLAEYVQRQCRVVIAGPTTLWSILNSLQMGFKTLAIQKRSSEVWNLLAAVKTEWTKYGDVLAKVQKKLQEASNTIEDAERRTRVIGRKLKSVQELPSQTAEAVLMLNNASTDSDAEESTD
jgi:DNA recombination protein RmuC